MEQYFTIYIYGFAYMNKLGRSADFMVFTRGVGLVYVLRDCHGSDYKSRGTITGMGRNLSVLMRRR